MQPLSFAGSNALIAQARRYLPGGVSSNFRLGISPTPLVFRRAEGPYLEDADGNFLIDYYLGMGPMILGHRPPEVVEAVVRQLERGILFGGQSEVEFEAAALVCQMVPCAERVRFGSSGTEVVQAALRLSRAATGRSAVVKFEGHYHGWLDNIYWAVAPGADAEPGERKATPGQDPLCGETLEVLAWNDIEVLRRRLEQRDVAAVIMEPAMVNAGAIAPARGYLEAVRDLCTASGTVLIFDEVITGFRLSAGGAQQLFGVTPDLAVFGKAIANGFPVAALAGRASLMDLFVEGGVMHGGTYNAQAVAMAATVATLKVLNSPGFYDQLAQGGRRLMEGIEDALGQQGVTASVCGFPQAFHVGLGLTDPPSNYRDLTRIDRPAYVRLTTALLSRGVRALERGVWFVSSAHSSAVIDATIEAWRGALAEVAANADRSRPRDLPVRASGRDRRPVHS